MIAIIGGGVCGLGIGWRLAQAGRAVTVFDRRQAGWGATWAAAGMLAPQVEAEPSEEPLLALAMTSRDMWADFAAEVETASDLKVDYRDDGTFVVAHDRDDVERLRDRHDFLGGLGLDLEWMSGDEAREREPHLAPGVSAAIFSALDHQVDNRKLAAALREAFIRAGGVLHENTPVTEVLCGGGQVTGVRTDDETLDAETVIVAAGPWSRDIPGLPDALRPQVRPLKGQMLAVQMPWGKPLLNHVVWGPDIYLVPRLDGRLLIGATVEEMGFDASITAGGIMDLLRDTWEILPGVYDLAIVETWAGFRPASRDDAPILGPTALDGLVMATGHHRNGILLAPITANAVADYVLSGEVPAAIAPFGIERFARPNRKARSA
jgi:glycine oxidase